MSPLLEQWVAALRQAEKREQRAGELLEALESGAETRSLEQELGVDAAHVREAAAPFSSETRARWKHAVAAAGGASAEAPGEQGGEKRRVAGDAPSFSPTKETSRWPFRVKMEWSAAAGGLAVAAALALWVFAKPAEPPPAGEEAAAVSYELSLPEADALWRSAPAPQAVGAAAARAEAADPAPGRAAREPHYTLGRELEVILRPSTRTAAVPQLAAWVRPLGGAPDAGWEPLRSAAVTRMPGGAMRLRVATGGPPFAVGRWELRLVVGGTGELKARFALGKPR